MRWEPGRIVCLRRAEPHPAKERVTFEVEWSFAAGVVRVVAAKSPAVAARAVGEWAVAGSTVADWAQVEAIGWWW